MISRLLPVVLLPVPLLVWPAAAYWTAFDQVFDVYPPEPLIAILDAGEPEWMRGSLNDFLDQFEDAE